MLDMHVHLLPGVDDGARTIDDARRMLEQAKECGVTAIVATPHLRPGTDARLAMAPYDEIRRLAAGYGIALYPGFEISHLRIAPGLGELADSHCLAGTKCFLLELHDDMLMPRWEAFLCDFVQRGYHPIIAHPERYKYIQRDPSVASEMCSYGCELQVDAMNLFAGMWSNVQRTARYLLSVGLISYIASDAHRPEDYSAFKRSYGKFTHEWPKQGTLNAKDLQKKQKL